MKKKLFIFLLIFSIFSTCLSLTPKRPPHRISHGYTLDNEQTLNVEKNIQTPLLAIVIDDFGGYEQAGVQELLESGIPITGAVIPEADNTEKNIDDLKNANCEVILHMPMESHVNLPDNWYGKTFIKNTDTPEVAVEKLDKCVKEFPEINGFNIHIGSGVSQNETLMKSIYEYANKNNLFLLDSRTIITNATEKASAETNSIYLGRDVFLEADKNKSYDGVVYRLKEAGQIAKEKGYAIAIGHVGAEGGENTAKAIIDTAEELKSMGVEIVPLSKVYNRVKQCSKNEISDVLSN